MSANDKWQQLQYKDEIVSVKVYSSAGDDKELRYILVEDIQDHFQDATTFRCGGKLVNFMRDADGKRLSPKRFAYLPGEIIQVIAPGSITSPQQLTKQNSTVLLSTSASPVEKDRFQKATALFEDFVKAMEDGQKKQADLIRGDFQQGFSELQAALDRNLDLQRQLNDMQQYMVQLQEQALDQLAIIQGRVQVLLTATYELHEYPIPRLFIILPRDSSAWDSVSILSNQFRLYFLCECGEHTKALSGNNTNIGHHIHLAKHEGYDLQRPTEFFQKYGRYMLILLEMIKYGVTIAGYAVPALSAINASGTIDMLKSSLETISPSALNQSIEYLQKLSSDEVEGQDPAKNTQTDSLTGQEALEGADLRHLEAFLKTKDEHRALGNLYRTITHEGHVKWVCINHYRLAYKEKDQQTFTTAVKLNGGRYDPHFGKVWIKLGSTIRAAEFYDALAKARRVDELDVTLDWECTASDLEALRDTLQIAAISILRLDIRRFRTSFGSTLLPTSTRYEVFARIVGLPSMKIVHIALSSDLVKLLDIPTTGLSSLSKLSYEAALPSLGEKKFARFAETLKTNSTLTTLSFYYNSIGSDGVKALAEALKTNSALTTLNLEDNSIGSDGAVALAEALKTNSALATLDLYHSSIGDDGAKTLAEALETNSALTTLYLEWNSIGDNGAKALAETLKTNSALTTLNLKRNSIGNDGAVALAEALKTNSALTTLYLNNNSIGDDGAVALAEALKTNSTLTTLYLEWNSIGDNGAKALTEALKTNSALTTLDLAWNSTGSDGVKALAEALKTNATLTSLNLKGNSIGSDGAKALAEALKTNSALTTLDLYHNSIGSDGAVALAEALKTNSALTTLDLEDNSIGSDGAKALAEALKTNLTLTTLNLESNSIGSDGAKALAEALKTNSALITLDLEWNSIGDNGAQALSEALKTNSALTTLNLEGNLIGYNGAQALSEALEANSTLTIRVSYLQSEPKTKTERAKSLKG
ncbi:hypothetical protein F5H01DRAFT_43380 [Linnemannia elongata]|nr:hypothetical protein F5H01DRAFT_43380 [Linnemannia elongata]